MIDLRAQLGRVHAISYIQYYDARPYNFQGWWTRESESGGLLDLAGVHEIDFMRAMCGDVKTVRAVAAPQIDARYDYSDTMHVLLEFRSGAVGSMNASLSYPLLRFREACGADVICRDGGLRLVTFLDHIDLYWQHKDDNHQRHERFDDLGFDHAFRKELGDFTCWINEGVTPCLTWQEGLRCVEIMEAAHRSARQGGCAIDLPLYPRLEA
jgi:predicted dehydrogenase